MASRSLALLSLVGGLAACASADAPPARSATLLLLTERHELLRVDAARPHKVLERRPVQGLAIGEALVGIDFRVARGVLYALSDRGRLFTLDPASGTLSALAAPPLALTGRFFGFDFNPAADRIRIVSDSGLNLRAHPDTGAAVDADPQAAGLQPDTPLAYRAGDANAGQAPALVAAGYTYHPKDEKLTTNYAIDRRLGVLVMQGSKEGEQPVVSPNGGQLTTVGPLGTGALADASFDIADAGGAALAALRAAGGGPTRLYRIDLASGRAQLLGTAGDGAPLRGLAIAP